MKSFYIIIAAKIVSLIGAIINTVGFLTFFFFDALKSHRWELIFGGAALIICSELISYFVGQNMLKGIDENIDELDSSAEVDEELEDETDEDEYVEYNCFYCNYGSDDEVTSLDPVPLIKSDAITRAVTTLTEAGDYFGIIDAEGTTVQFMLEESGEVLVEIPTPQELGSYGKQIHPSEVKPFLKSLLKKSPDEFEIDEIPGLTFVAW